MSTFGSLVDATTTGRPLDCATSQALRASWCAAATPLVWSAASAAGVGT